MFEVMQDLSVIKADLLAKIDKQAGAVRGRYITTTPGQEMIYLEKRREAELILADPGQGDNVPDASTPHITSEASQHGVTRFEKAVEVVTMAQLWATISPAIETLRLAAKDAVNAATTVAQARAAANITWPT